MVESGDKKTQNPPSADDLARAEHYAAMMAAIAREEEDDDLDLDGDDLEDDDFIKRNIADQNLL